MKNLKRYTYSAHIVSIVPRIKNHLVNLLKAHFVGKNWKIHEVNPPMILQFETTNLCNANCIFCGYQYEKRPKKIMNMDLFNKILDEYISIGGEAVCLHPMVGEPLIDPHILERLSIINGKTSIKMSYFYTNGILLDKIGITKLLVSGVNEIHVSTAGFDKDMYDRLYKSRDYGRVVSNIHELLKKNNEMGRPVKVTIEIRSDEPIRKVLNKKDFKEKILPYIDINDISFLLYFDDWGGLITQNDLTGNMKLAKPKRGRRPCARTFAAFVNYDGKLRACGCRSLFEDVDELIIGDLHKSSLKDIWYGENLKILRKSFECKDIPKVCQKCSMYTPI